MSLPTPDIHRMDQQITLHDSYRRMNRTQGKLLCCCEGKFLRGFKTSWWLSVCISFTLGPPCPPRWQDVAWISARSHKSRCITGSGPSSPRHVEWAARWASIPAPTRTPPAPPPTDTARHSHVLGPPCQASAPGLITGPAGMAPISWICYNHLRSSHSVRVNARQFFNRGQWTLLGRPDWPASGQISSEWPVNNWF